MMVHMEWNDKHGERLVGDNDPAWEIHMEVN